MAKKKADTSFNFGALAKPTPTTGGKKAKGKGGKTSKGKSGKGDKFGGS